MATSTPSWQRLIWAAIFLVVCEGAIRKWIAPGFQAEVYLVKDALLVLAYIGFLSSRIPTGIHLKAMAGLTTLLTFSLVYFALQVFNPNSPSFLLSIIGFKNYLLYVPLAFVVPYMFSSSKDLEHKLKKYAIIMIPFAALGLVQFGFGPDHWLNDYVSHDLENARIIAMFGEEDAKARTTGTFSYPGGYTTFLTVMLYLGVALAASKNWRFSGNLWPWTLVVVSIAAVFTTGSRGPIYGSLITAPVVLYVWTSRGIISTGNFMKVGLAGALIAIVVAFIASSAIEAYSYRAEHADNPMDRLLSPLTESYDVLTESPIIGAGLASTHASAITIMGTKDYWWLNGKFAEQEPARVLQEAGVLGFILVYAARIWLLVKAISLGRRFRTPVYAAMAGVIAGFFAQYLFLIVINNPTGGVYYWFAAGLLFAMYRLEMQGATASLPASASKRQQLRRAAAAYGMR
jgi:O-Antigen ligase